MQDPRSNPLAGNPLESRADVERAALALFRALVPHYERGEGRVLLGSSGAYFGLESEGLEGFLRPLWAMVPLAVGGGDFPYWELVTRGIACGTDPGHPKYWGVAGSDQRLVEMAVLGVALSWVPDRVWEPLAPIERDRLVRLLEVINERRLTDNNWHFFRVLVNQGLSNVGRKSNELANAESLARLDAHYEGDGVYRDGRPGAVDYYVPWAYHTYGLLYASAPNADPAWAERCRSRARAFAPEYAHWFDANGAAVPFGRSLCYRFAQGSFWGALALANEEALPWRRIKGLYLRHLRYWSALPISDRDGVLSLGYGYSNPAVVEPYSSASSVYWCMKYFLALAAREDHPFWTADEEPADAFEASLEPRVAVPVAGRVVTRDRGHVVWLSAGADNFEHLGAPEKYGKFAYSSRFAFSVGVREHAPHHGVYDSMLALRDPDGLWRGRGRSLKTAVEGRFVLSRWQPFADVIVDTLLVATGGPFHLRLHRIVTARALHSLEQGFALGRDPHDDRASVETRFDAPSGMFAETPFGASGIVDRSSPGALNGPGDAAELTTLLRPRSAELRVALPNTHLLYPRTVIPSLVAELAPGTHLFACAVFATDGTSETALASAPEPDGESWDALVEFARAPPCALLSQRRP